MCNVTLNRYHAEIYFFPITCATEFFFSFFFFFFAKKKSLFRHFSGFKKHYVAFSKKLILALGERYKSVYRYVLCLNIILNSSMSRHFSLQQVSNHFVISDQNPGSNAFSRLKMPKNNLDR